MDALQQKISQLTPEQQASVTQKIQSGNLSEREQQGLEKFRQQNTPPVVDTPTTTPTPVNIPPTTTLPKAEPVETTLPPSEPIETPKIETIDQFKSAGANTENLEKFIETRYGTNAEVVGNKVKATVNGKTYEWDIDQQGNPNKVEVPTQVTKTPEALEAQNKQLAQVSQREKEAQEMGISFSKRQDGTIVYKPDSLDDVFELYAKYGDSVKFAGATAQEIKGGILYNKLKSKVGVDKDTLVSSLKAGEIAFGGETWDYLTKLNGGVSPEMLEAKKEYDKYLDDKKTIDLQNSMFDALEGKEVDTGSFYKSIMESMNTMFAKQEEQFQFANSRYETKLAEYKAKQTETNSKFSKMNDLQTELETLEDERDDIIRNVKKQYPNLDYSTQLLIAQNQTLAVDDAIKIKNREYTNAFRSYEQARQIDLEIYNEEVKNIDRDVKFMQQVFQNQSTQFQMGANLAMSEFEYARQTQREDMNYQRDIARQDQLLEQEQKLASENRELDFKYKMAEAKANMSMQYDYAVKIGDYELANQIALKQADFEMAGGKISYDENGFPVYNTGSGTMGGSGLLGLLNSGTTPVSGLSVPNNPNATALLNAKDGDFIPTRLKGPISPGNPGGKECGEYVNDITGLGLGDKLEDKLSKMTNKGVYDFTTGRYISDESVGIGHAVVWNPGKNQWGHTGIVIADNGDSVLVRSSNMSNDGKISDDWVEKSKLLGSTPTNVTYATQENDNLVKRLGDIGLSSQSIANIYMSSPTDLVKSGELAFTGTNESELSVIKNEISKVVSKTASEFGVSTPGDLITSLGGSLSRMSDEDIKLIQGGLVQSLMSGNKEEVTKWIKRQVQNGSEKNGLKKVQDGLPQIKTVATYVGILKNAYDELDDDKKEAFNTNILNGNIAKAKKILGQDSVYAELDQAIGFLRKDYQLTVSGQASTDAEFEAIAEFFPKVTNVNSLNQKLIEGYFNFYTKSSLGALESQLKNFNVDIYDLYPEIKSLTSGSDNKNNQRQKDLNDLKQNNIDLNNL